MNSTAHAVSASMLSHTSISMSVTMAAAAHTLSARSAKVVGNGAISTSSFMCPQKNK
jgi:hypothetical protein